jgi:hypothetical protein
MALLLTRSLLFRAATETRFRVLVPWWTYLIQRLYWTVEMSDYNINKKWVIVTWRKSGLRKACHACDWSCDLIRWWIRWWDWGQCNLWLWLWLWLWLDKIILKIRWPCDEKVKMNKNKKFITYIHWQWIFFLSKPQLFCASRFFLLGKWPWCLGEIVLIQILWKLFRYLSSPLDKI